MPVDEILIVITTAVAIISLLAVVGGGVVLDTARRGWKTRVAAISMLSGIIGLLASIVMVIVCIALSKSM